MLRQAAAAQLDVVAEWHGRPPKFAAEGSAMGFPELLLRQHWCNFRFWHVEDRARRRDAGAELVAECKDAIDKLNQERNDFIERLDQRLQEFLEPLLPAPDQGARPRHATETLGMALDRCSILALKIFHMHEQTKRQGVAQPHVTECARKLVVIEEQRVDLVQVVLDLLEEYARGLKRPKVYFQFKMYNDPRLNPELYGRG